jgi:PhzF family phenazine biosynthesis protein
MKIAHYSVFAAAPGGGKQFAIVEGVDNPVEMQRIAAQTGQPLTGFILNTSPELVEARFFSPSKEKGASDSGALVIGEHLRRLGRAGDSLTVQMGGEGLEVFYHEGKWWGIQEDTCVIDKQIDKSKVLATLGLPESDCYIGEVFLTGGSKLNVAIPVKDNSILDNIKPDFASLKALQQEWEVNGFVAMTNSSRGLPDYRFFSPAKGLPEDNAGSYTLASICGYIAQKYTLERQNDSMVLRLEAAQGYSMGKPSNLIAEFLANAGHATRVRIGGKVERLEVSHA